MDEKELISNLIDLAEEHWTVLLYNLEQKGYKEEEIDEAFEKLKKNING